MRMNLGGHGWSDVDGYGRLTIGVAQAMMRAGHDVFPFELRDLDKPSWFLQSAGYDFSHVTIQLAPPYEFHHIPGRSFSYTMHESMSLPDGWADHINQKSQMLMVPSPWLVPVFEDAGVKLPIEIVPGGIDPADCPLVMPSRNRPYKFGCLADRGTRKGWDMVHSAFYKAFDYRDRNVRLLIKCRPGSLDRLDFSYSPDPRLVLWRTDVKGPSEMFQPMDAYICPARCEGYGMSQRESAACGVPTVVQRFSGTADDVDKWAIPLDRFTLVESHMKGSGGLWAEPCEDEIVETMRWLYTHQDEAKRNALKAAQWMRQHATYDHAAHRLNEVLSRYLGGGPVDSLPMVDTLPTTEQPTTLNLRANGHKTTVVMS